MKHTKTKGFKPMAGLALAVAVGAQFVTMGHVNAQAAAAATTTAPDSTQADTATTSLDTMMVTGSNIPTAEEVGPNPVQVIDRAEIDRSTYSTAEELIKSLPAANNGGVPLSNNGTGFTPGASAVSLRGLGPDATLVLINGRRIAPYPTGQGGSTSFIDLNSIPAAAIESIEILTDGASTQYGADAVAGVVNIKLRKDYQGAEITTRVGNTTDKDSTELSTSMVFGSTSESTRITGVVSYYHRNSIFNKDRGYSQMPPFQSSNSIPGNFSVTAAAAEAAIGFNPYTDGGATGYATAVSKPVLGLNKYGNANVYYGPTNVVANGFLFNDSEANPLSGSSRPSAFNFNSTSGSLPELEKYGSAITFEHDIAGEKLTLYGTATYSFNYTRNELAPVASGNFLNPLGVTIVVPANAPGPVYQASDTAGTPTGNRQLSDASYNPFNPFQQELSGGSRFRTAEFGNRVLRDETNAVIGQFGIKGRNLFGNWGYDLSGNYSRVETNNRDSGFVSASKFNRILDASSSIFDPGSNDYIGTSTPYNPFVGATGAANSPLLVKYAGITTKDRAESELWTTDANIYNPELITLPGGGLGVAFGGQFRREQINQQPDTYNLDGDVIGNSTGSATNAGRKTVGVYGELNVPIFGGTFTLPGIYDLEVNGSVRYEQVQNTSDNVLVPKVSLKWQPIADLTLRGTYGKGYRQPSLYELFGPANAGLTAITNQLNGESNQEATSVTVGNRNLQPEDSETFTAGFVYSPKFVPGLTVSAGYWQIERSGEVTADSAATYQRFVSGTLLPGESVSIIPGEDPTDPQQVNLITTPYNNTARTIVKGYDMGLSYKFPVTPIGNFTFNANATYLESYKQTLIDGSEPLQELAGQLEGGLGAGGTAEDAYIRWKGLASLIYDYQAFQTVATVNYTDGFSDLDLNDQPYRVNYQATLDLQMSYDFGVTKASQIEASPSYSKDGKTVEAPMAAPNPKSRPWYHDTKLTVGVRNVTDEKPPTAYGDGGNSTGYPDFIYTSEGRFVYLELSKKF